MSVLRVAAAFKETERWGGKAGHVDKVANAVVIAQIPFDFAKWSDEGYRKQRFDSWRRECEAAIETVGWPKTSSPHKKDAASGDDPNVGAMEAVSLEFLENRDNPAESLLIAHLPSRVAVNASWGGRSARDRAKKLEQALSCALGTPALDIGAWALEERAPVNGAVCALELATRGKRESAEARLAAGMGFLCAQTDWVLRATFALPQFRAQIEAQELAAAVNLVNMNQTKFGAKPKAPRAL